jgi:hypothetical protein
MKFDLLSNRTPESQLLTELGHDFELGYPMQTMELIHCIFDYL